jgi:hypothetical protein
VKTCKRFHLRSICRKLQLSSRVDLARMVTELRADSENRPTPTAFAS